jgi:peptidoglycan/LPS O-acetylase OafA/YrhL
MRPGSGPVANGVEDVVGTLAAASKGLSRPGIQASTLCELRMQYVKGLDGIRGISIIFVMLFHFGYFPAGWIGVQIFFVLSGYLITTILLQQNTDFKSYIARFYLNRALRIFPLYFMFLTATAVIYSLLAVPPEWSTDWPWLITYTSNFARLRPQDLPTFVHTWSLAVEEQFYLVWPFVIFLLPGKSLRIAVVALLVLSPIARLITFDSLAHLGSEYAGRATYSMMFTQMDAFASGGAVSILRLNMIRTPLRWFLLSLSTAAVAGGSILVVKHIWQGGAMIRTLGFEHFLLGNYEYVWGYSLINIISALLIVCVLRRVSIVRPLESAPLTSIGKISYGIYIYHLPLLLIGEFMVGHALEGWGRGSFFVIWVIAVLAFSQASFHYIERPFLRLKTVTKPSFPSVPFVSVAQENLAAGRLGSIDRA